MTRRGELHSPIKKNPRPIALRILRSIAIGFFIVYVCWNVTHLWLGLVPPSMLTGSTGIPSPTTGGTRSIRLLLEGRFSESLRANAMAIPISALFVVSMVWLLINLIRSKRFLLPRWMIYVWFGVLALAWLLKLVGDRQYW